MRPKYKRFLVLFLTILALLVVVLAALGGWTVRRSFPELSGELRLPGLVAPVEVSRDTFGVPHIYAANEHDLFFAQGYVHAQDRFWQMDFWRHIGSGRLSEMFGEGQVKADTFLRTLGWARVAQQELDALDPKSVAILKAYADGVNAYLASHAGSAISLEYGVLGLLNASYRPEPWKPIHSLTWAKAMAWDLGGNLDGEIMRAQLLKTLTPAQIADILPAYPSDHPIIIPSPGAAGQVAKLQSPAGYQAILAGLDPQFANFSQQSASLAALLGPHGSGIGSNNWVISGKRTATGKPLLANDPHLGIQMPSIWYQIGLHCQPVGPDCRFNAAGFSFAGDPGIIIGHNDHIAWGFTNVGPDVQDLYIEKINPQNPDQYEVNGQWQDMTLVKETIQVSGGQPVDLLVRYTRHGPVIASTQSATYGDLEGFTGKAGIELPAEYALALRWTALEPTNTFPAIWQIDLAQNWDEFRQGASHFDVPSQNLVYADVDGNIGYQTPGHIPIRAHGDGTLPAPGWTDEYEWTGYIPFDELPTAFNPSQGYLVTANNALVGPDYPYLISSDWDYGYRAQRIVELIENAPGPIDAAYIQQIQGDDKDLSAASLIKPLSVIPLDDTRLETARQLLLDWDGQMRMESPAAALYAAFWKNLLAQTFHDDLPEAQWPEGGSRWMEVMRRLASQPNSPWWDDRTTAPVEGRDAILVRAFSQAVDEMEKQQGQDPQKWRWGSLHTATFRNQTLGKSGVGFIEALFNRGPFPTAGGDGIVNATGWNAVEPYTVDWLPSMRMIVDLSNLENSLAIHTTGQSGHAYAPHYIDMADLWRNIQYHPMLWSRAQVQANQEGVLHLIP